MIQPNIDERRAELSDFLRSRRARLSPLEVGLLDGRRRRTPGLRREEVALLANIGATWYTRLEQGLPINVSGEVLENIAQALRLDRSERRHLFTLAGHTIAESGQETDEVVSDLLLRTLHSLAPNPAYVRGRRWDILAYNEPAATLFGFDRNASEPENLVWRFFTSATERTRYRDWENVGRKVVAKFRSSAARYPDDPAFRILIARLQERSEEFSRWWAQHDVCEVTEGMKVYIHPEAGELKLDHNSLLVPDSDMRLTVYTTEPGSSDERRLHELVLGSLVAR